MEDDKNMFIPWHLFPLSTWSIYKMQTYRVEGAKFIEIVVIKDDKEVRMQGLDNAKTWHRLNQKIIDL